MKENVFVKEKGQKWYSKEFPYPLDNPKSLYERNLSDIADEYPEILIAAVIQKESDEMFEQPNYEDNFSFKCENTEILVSHIGISSFCGIVL